MTEEPQREMPRTPIEQLKWAAFRLSTAPPSAAIEAQAAFDSALESVERELRAYHEAVPEFVHAFKHGSYSEWADAFECLRVLSAPEPQKQKP